MREFIVRHKQKITYFITGAWNTLFGYGSFVLLYGMLSQKINYTIILTLSYILSITNAYIGYKLFVFKTKGGFLREYLRFYVVYGGAYVVNIVLFPVLTVYMGINPYFAQVIITFFIVVFSYISHKNYSFGR